MFDGPIYLGNEQVSRSSLVSSNEERFSKFSVKIKWIFHWIHTKLQQKSQWIFKMFEQLGEILWNSSKLSVRLNRHSWDPKLSRFFDSSQRTFKNSEILANSSLVMISDPKRKITEASVIYLHERLERLCMLLEFSQ